MHRLRFAEEVMRECTTVLDRMDDDSKAQDVPQYPKKWYPERGSNPHVLIGQRILSPLRLPIPPSGRTFV